MTSNVYVPSSIVYWLCLTSYFAREEFQSQECQCAAAAMTKKKHNPKNDLRKFHDWKELLIKTFIFIINGFFLLYVQFSFVIFVNVLSKMCSHTVMLFNVHVHVLLLYLPCSVCVALTLFFYFPVSVARLPFPLFIQMFVEFISEPL